jgi:hypothetical protein
MSEISEKAGATAEQCERHSDIIRERNFVLKYSDQFSFCAIP